MTGYFAQGRRQRYAYYKCFKRDCPTRKKSYPANEVHNEFVQFLMATSVAHYAAESIVTQLLKVHWDETESRRQASQKRQDARDRLKRELQELIAMRVKRLVADDEFVTQREQISHKLLEIESSCFDTSDTLLTATEIAELPGILSSLETTWNMLPVEARRGFSDIVLPRGYVFQKVRTAEKGLLFKTIEPSGSEIQDLVPLIKGNLNTIVAEARKLLALVKPAQRPGRKAA
jgi:hypothetical protein